MSVEDLSETLRRRAAEPRPGFTEDELALEFTRRHRHELRYVAAWSNWMRWTGSAWCKETTLEAYDLARAICRDIGAGLDNEKVRARILSASTRAAVENLARADRAHAAVTEQWDASPWLLNAAESITCDLRTGATRAPDPMDYMTKVAAVRVALPDTFASLWTAFLDRVTAGDLELQTYLQRVAGYCLTGSVSEHALFFVYGTGANGKSVFVNTLVDVWGDYALTVGTDMLLASNVERHPTEVARLRGVRLAIGSEIEIGRTWAESKIKALTGGDRLQGRFMRQDFFEFDPTFKLMIVGNHKPSLRGVGEAIRRRLHLIPFTVTIPADDRDPDLSEKLKAEGAAILRWAIDGCLARQREGLNPPAAVRDATTTYLAAEDTFELWRDARTTPDPNRWESSDDLWRSWKNWAEDAGEFIGRRKAFSQLLEERGVPKQRQPGTGARGYRGCRLRRRD